MLTTLLVGAYHRPPAKIVIEHLPAKCPLKFEPEPENQWDEHAIKVLVNTSDIPLEEYDDLRDNLPSCGFELDEVLAEPSVFLGYVAKTGGKPLAGTGFIGNQELTQELAQRGLDWTSVVGTLGWTPEGKPTVSIPSGSVGLADLPEEESKDFDAY